jgi:glycosyltransferase involved in cell wall biosynthesis
VDEVFRHLSNEGRSSWSVARGSIQNPAGKSGVFGTGIPASSIGDPLVSVIVPSYNHAGFIRQAIYSVANQTYRNVELIVIDDGSRDHSPSVISDTLEGLAAIKAQLFVQDNKGAHDAINRGILLARGEYIAILNSDDFYYPCRMEKLVGKARRDGCEFVFSKVDFVSSNNLLERHRGKSAYIQAYEASKHLPSLGFALMGYNLAVTTSNCFMKKSLVDRVGLFHDYIIVHDWDYLLRVLLESEPCLLDESLLAYRVHEHNTLSRLGHVGPSETQMIFGHYARAVAAGKAPNKLAPQRGSRRPARKTRRLSMVKCGHRLSPV